MRQLHVYDCALMAALPMRLLLATMLVAGSLVITVGVATPAAAEPETCPPVCDQIPGAAWIQRRAVPMNAVYRWPALGAVATALTGRHPGSGSRKSVPHRPFRTTSANRPLRAARR
ncbi:hypothetical protein YM3MPS_50040 [Mycobacterium pseudoshottsii]|nr:hypothetical protein MMSP_1210 [Mycobacterium sp. 012931]MBC9864146.1 hypothetical protein [Mycobacterium pseudoshottsii]RFZ68968.1 hypothetical protein DL240490_01566 [Mycobacterium marinum]BEH79201.1 hypothetical protein YM3MPS_50040 [Mycobacterium pseudoshottsii]